MSKTKRLRLRRRMVGWMGAGALGLGLTAGSCGRPPAAPSQWYSTCGDPVCHGYDVKAGVAKCTTETLGASCATGSASCDPIDSCNVLYVCADKDPKQEPGGCPISRRQYKTDISYLDQDGLQRYADELSRVKLATYKYKTGGPTRLGFIIEDHEPSVSIDSDHDLVDLYGYTSMAVAALKLQQKRIDELQAQVAALSAQLGAAKSRRR